MAPPPVTQAHLALRCPYVLVTNQLAEPWRDPWSHCLRPGGVLRAAAEAGRPGRIGAKPGFPDGCQTGGLGMLPATSHCLFCVLQEMANSVYLVMEVSPGGQL